VVDAGGWLCDTNILLRLYRVESLEHLAVRSAVGSLLTRKVSLYFARQNVAEFWNVSTRPCERNGLGMAHRQVLETVEQFEQAMMLLPEPEESYWLWRELVVRYQVRGVQVHDARLVAAMQANGLLKILTLNVGDFQRYAGVEAVHPKSV
jgi:predicted nucleic acid-binding protein